MSNGRREERTEIEIDSEFYRQCLPFARGEVAADLVIRNARLANVFSLEYELTDVAVARGIIVGVGTGYLGKETVDAGGKSSYNLRLTRACFESDKAARIKMPGTTQQQTPVTV